MSSQSRARGRNTNQGINNYYDHDNRGSHDSYSSREPAGDTYRRPKGGRNGRGRGRGRGRGSRYYDSLSVAGGLEECFKFLCGIVKS